MSQAGGQAGVVLVQGAWTEVRVTFLHHCTMGTKGTRWNLILGISGAILGVVWL